MRGWGHVEYSLSESEAGPLPQDKFHELALTECSVRNEEKISHRQQMLVCAKSQRDLYPVEGFIGNTAPCLLAQAHIQLGEAYRSTPGHLRQVKKHARQALKDLSKKSVKSPPLLKYETPEKAAEHEAQVEQLKRAAYKSLGEAYMEQTPPAYTRALEMFAQAVPGLPDFSLMLKRSRGNCLASQKDMQDVPSTDTLSDETSAALLKEAKQAKVLQDLPFASAVGSCFKAAAGELLDTLEHLHTHNQEVLAQIRAQIMEIITMERSLVLDLPNPGLCATGASTLDFDAVDSAACDQILETLAASAIAGSTPELALDHQRMTTMDRWRRTIKIAANSKASIMHMIVRAAMQPLPAISTANWVKVNPVQKLEQLCMMLVMARAEREPVAVLFSTAGVAEYMKALLKYFEEQQYFLFGALLGITSGMTWPQKTGVLEAIERKKFGVVMSTETALTGMNMTQFRHIVYFDYTPGIPSVGACALPHASVTFFLQPTEYFAVEVLQLAGLPLPQTSSELRSFHMDTERGQRIEKVMQRCKDATLTSAGVSACVEYISWYRNSKQVYILSPSTLDMPSLRHIFLLPSKDEAVSSMVNSVAVSAAYAAQRQALEGTGLTVPGSTRLTKTGAGEEEVQPGLLENLIAAEEAVVTWSTVRRQRRDKERNLSKLTQEFCNLQSKLRRIPGYAHSAADQAVTLLYCVTTELSGSQDQAPALEKLQHKLWYISGRLILNDLTKAEEERMSACMQQLDQILMTQECHPGALVVSHALQAKTLKLYGKCAMKIGDSSKAEQLFVRLCNLCSGGKKTSAGRIARQIDGAEARMLLGAVLATKGKYAQAGEAYEQAMKVLKHLRPQLPADNSLRQQLEQQMIELLHAQQDGQS